MRKSFKFLLLFLTIFIIFNYFDIKKNGLERTMIDFGHCNEKAIIKYIPYFSSNDKNYNHIERIQNYSIRQFCKFDDSVSESHFISILDTFFIKKLDTIEVEKWKYISFNLYDIHGTPLQTSYSDDNAMQNTYNNKFIYSLTYDNGVIENYYAKGNIYIKYSKNNNKYYYNNKTKIFKKI